MSENLPVNVTPADEIYAEMFNQLDLEPVGWRPVAGAKIVGRVIDVDMCDCGDYGEHPLLTVLTETGAVNVHGFHDVLRNAITRHNIQQGDIVAIKYTGKIAGGAHDGYENYNMIVRRDIRD